MTCCIHFTNRSPLFPSMVLWGILTSTLILQHTLIIEQIRVSTCITEKYRITSGSINELSPISYIQGRQYYNNNQDEVSYMLFRGCSTRAGFLFLSTLTNLDSGAYQMTALSYRVRFCLLLLPSVLFRKRFLYFLPPQCQMAVSGFEKGSR